MIEKPPDISIPGPAGSIYLQWNHSDPLTVQAELIQSTRYFSLLTHYLNWTKYIVVNIMDCTHLSYNGYSIYNNNHINPCEIYSLPLFA